MFDLATFLGGSFIGVIIQQGFTFINKKREFKYEVFKLSYVKRLEIAESAITFYINHNSKIRPVIGALKIIIENFKNKTFENDLEFIITNFEKNIKNYESLNQEYFYKTSSICLYFDIDYNFEYSNRHEKILLIAGRFKEFSEHANYLRGNLSFNLHYKKTLCNSPEFNKKLDQVILDFEYLLSIFVSSEKGIYESIKTIRENINSTKFN